MDTLMPLFWLCAAITAVAAMALSLFARTQRSHRGFGWWIGALWLNAYAASTSSSAAAALTATNTQLNRSK